MTHEITVPIGLTLTAARQLRDALDMEIARIEAIPPPPPDKLTASYPGLRRESLLNLAIADIAKRHGGRIDNTGYSLALDVREVTIDFDVALGSDVRGEIVDALLKAGVANVELF